MRGFTMIETLIMVAIVAAALTFALIATGKARDVVLGINATHTEAKRKVAIDQMYDTHGITADEIWLQAAKSELLRRGLSGPSPLTRQSLAAYLDGLNLDPPFAVPDRYDARTLQALGLPEPEFR